MFKVLQLEKLKRNISSRFRRLFEASLNPINFFYFETKVSYVIMEISRLKSQTKVMIVIFI